MPKTESRRRELLRFAESGRLRDAAHSSGLGSDATDLLVDVVMRYCEPRRKPLWKRLRDAKGSR